MIYLLSSYNNQLMRQQFEALRLALTSIQPLQNCIIECLTNIIETSDVNHGVMSRK